MVRKDCCWSHRRSTTESSCVQSAPGKQNLTSFSNSIAVFGVGFAQFGVELLKKLALVSSNARLLARQ